MPRTRKERVARYKVLLSSLSKAIGVADFEEARAILLRLEALHQLIERTS